MKTHHLLNYHLQLILMSNQTLPPSHRNLLYDQSRWAQDSKSPLHDSSIASRWPGKLPLRAKCRLLDRERYTRPLTSPSTINCSAHSWGLSKQDILWAWQDARREMAEKADSLREVASRCSNRAIESKKQSRQGGRCGES